MSLLVNKDDDDDCLTLCGETFCESEYAEMQKSDTTYQDMTWDQYKLFAQGLVDAFGCGEK